MKATGAVGLWNSMLQSVGNKAKTFTPDDKIKCPTEKHPYVFTNKNSN